MNQTSSVSHARPMTERTAIVAAAAFAMLLGIFTIWGVGFAGAETLHNAAHDTRHTNNFPCH